MHHLTLLASLLLLCVALSSCGNKPTDLVLPEPETTSATMSSTTTISSTTTTTTTTTITAD